MILVTGGTGMAGSFIVRELQRRGLVARILARPESMQIARDLGADVALGDLMEVDSVRQAAQGVSGIIHVACTFSQPDIDSAAMEALLETWGEGSFVFISSVDVYGLPQWVPVTEDHPVDSTYSPYASGKVHCEAQLQAAARTQGRTDFSILRPPHIWGPHPTCYRRLVNERIRTSQPVILPGPSGDERMQFGDAWVDARELAWVAVECLVKPLGGSANTITGHFRWQELYAELIRLVGSTSDIQHKALEAISEEELSNKRFYAQTWQYSGERLRQHLSIQPSYRWQETLAEVIKHGERVLQRNAETLTPAPSPPSLRRLPLSQIGRGGRG